MKRVIVFFLLSLVIFPIIACQSGGSGTPGATVEYEIKPAPIEELRISFAKSLPPQVIVYIKGGLADAATVFNEIKVGELKDKTVTITVTTRRPKGVPAAQVYGYFEQNVNLGSNFTQGQTYKVNVNDKSVEFVMQ